MKLVLALALSSFALAGAVSAQTAGDVLEAEGRAGFTNIQRAIGEELIRQGVPQSCMEQIPMAAVGQISAIVASGLDGDKEGQIEAIIERVCGEL